MPTYEYECTGCRHRFEEFQSITADPILKCPKCSRPVRRLIGAGVGIIFKGSGFYTTDYKNSSATSSNGSRKKEGDSSAKRDESKNSSSDSKSDSKSSKTGKGDSGKTS